MTTRKLDMDHGFMQCIIRNQIARDNYDKEVQVSKTSKGPKTASGGNRSKKPSLETYKPPVSRRQQETVHVHKNPLFHFEYEDQNGEVHPLDIYKLSELEQSESNVCPTEFNGIAMARVREHALFGDDPESLARQLGREQGFNIPMIRALTDFLKAEIKKRLESE